VCVCVVLLASLHGDVSAFVSVLFAGQTVERVVRLATVKKNGSSLLLSSVVQRAIVCGGLYRLDCYLVLTRMTSRQENELW